jgi:hypothetical protein
MLFKNEIQVPTVLMRPRIDQSTSQLNNQPVTANPHVEDSERSFGQYSGNLAQSTKIFAK